MFYMVYATAQVPPGTLERAVFYHPGSSQDVMAFIQKVIGPNRRVPYQVQALGGQRPPEPAVLCTQMKFAAPAKASSSEGPNMGGADIPSELTPMRPGSEPIPQVGPSSLGDKYASVPEDIRGEF